MRSAIMALGLLASLGSDLAAQEKVQGEATWTDLKQWKIEGKGFTDTLAHYDRLPERAQKTVRPPVWSLSRHSAGLAVRFVTDAPEIWARWTLLNKSLALPHMPATGVSGVDLYVKDKGQWRWLGIGRPESQTNTARLVAGLPKGTREFLLYLPLYNGVASVEIGTPKGHSIQPAPNYPAGHEKPIVFYGTSITQGGCASRPGMVHTALVGRWLDRPIINLGFSGNGRMEAEVIQYIAEIDASIYVIDCLPNMGAKEVAERTEPLVKQLRKARPTTPILLVEDRTYSNALILPSIRERNDSSRKELKATFHRLQQAGVKGVYYLEGEDLLGGDNEGTVDNSHPTDLGFFRQAEVFTRALRPILGK